jgi:hypothetical protein
MDINYIFYIIASLAIGVIILLVLRYMGGFPFPWQLRTITKRASEPDSSALSECFSKLSNNEEIHIVMGIVNYLVCEQEIVINSLKKALERDVEIKLIHGPEVDTRSKRFLNLLGESPKAKIYRFPESPEIHFRVLIDAKGPREVYVEEPHIPYEDKGYRRISSRRVSRQYDQIFHKMLDRCRALA